MQNNSLLTILVPTKNRADFLERLLTYYAKQRVNYCFLIGDASDSRQAPLIQKVIKSVQGQLQISYQYFPGLGIAGTIEKLNVLVKTPYVTLLPDDDLLMPGGVKACLDFLQGNPKYAAANGLAALFLLDEGGPYGHLMDIGDYPLGSLEEKNALDRLDKLLDRYFVVLFGIHRISVWRDMWCHGSDLEDVAMAAEILPNCLSAVLGPTKHLDVFYLLRQGHDQRYLLKDTYDWIASQGWSKAQMVLTNTLAGLLSTKDSLALDESQKFVKKFFWKYLSTRLTHGFNSFCQNQQKTIREKLKQQAPFTRALLAYARNVKIYFLDFKRRLSLRKLRDQTSGYWHDFGPFEELLRKGRI